MSNHSWTAAHLATIGASASKFPETPVTHWMELRSAPARVRELMADANTGLAAIEDDRQLTPEGKQAKAAQLGRDAIAGLEKSTEAAAKAAQRRIDALNAKLATVIEKAADASVAAEIRRHIATQPSPVMAALKLKDNKETVSALLSAPSYLSGLTDADTAILRTQVLSATAEQKEIGEIQSALKVVQQAVASASSMVSTRAQLRAGASLDDLRAAAKVGAA